MNPIRAINQAAGKALRMDGMPQGTATRDNLVEIAELHKLKDPALQFVLAKYNHDISAMAKSAIYLKKIARRLAARRGWECDVKTLHNAAILALLQHVEPRKLGHTCYGCNGTGGEVNTQCNTCLGSGYKSRPDEIYAAVMEVTVDAFSKIWDSRVKVLYNIASRWDDDMWTEWLKRQEEE